MNMVVIEIQYHFNLKDEHPTSRPSIMPGSPPFYGGFMNSIPHSPVIFQNCRKIVVFCCTGLCSRAK